MELKFHDDVKLGKVVVGILGMAPFRLKTDSCFALKAIDWNRCCLRYKHILNSTDHDMKFNLETVSIALAYDCKCRNPRLKAIQKARQTYEYLVIVLVVTWKNILGLLDRKIWK